MPYKPSLSAKSQERYPYDKKDVMSRRYGVVATAAHLLNEAIHKGYPDIFAQPPTVDRAPAVRVPQVVLADPPLAQMNAPTAQLLEAYRALDIAHGAEDK